MKTFSDISAARAAIMTCLMSHGGDLNEPQREQVLKFGTSPSPVDQIVKTAEYLYSERAATTAPWRELAGGLASFAAENGWHGLGGEENRGGTIARIMARENGEKAPTGQKWPAVADDLAPAPEFVERPVPVTTAAPTD